MSILKISQELSSIIATKSQKIKAFHQNDIDDFLKSDDSFQHIFDSAKKVLDENYFVVIKNIGFIREKSIFEAFVKLFGDFYGAVEYTNIKLECPYTGCNYKPIELHNDDAIDVEKQPLYGFIQVQNEDPLKLAYNGLVKIDDLVNYLELHDTDFLTELLTAKINMLAYGVNYDGKNKKKILINEPILCKRDGEYQVRFDLTRIKFYYWKEKKVQSLDNRLLIDRFLNLAKNFRREVYLEKGDILIHNNKKTLHDRTETSLELMSDGTYNTREIFVSFAR